MDGGFGKRAEVPGGSAVVAAQRFAPVQPRQRAVQQRGAAHLAPVVGRGVSLHGGSHGVAVVRGDGVALSVDVKKYIHFLGERILRGVHVGMAKGGVVRVRVLPIEHGRVVVAHPPRLVRGDLHLPRSVLRRCSSSSSSSSAGRGGPAVGGGGRCGDGAEPGRGKTARRVRGCFCFALVFKSEGGGLR